MVPSWDLGLVLAALTQPPFEPLESISLRCLSQKVAFLLAVASTKRVGELHALSVGPGCLRFGPDLSGVTLRPNPSFLPKVMPHGHVNSPWHLSAYAPPLGDVQSGGGPSPLCPVRALATYVSRTQSVRQTDQLFVCYGARALGQGLSRQRLSHWVVDAISTTYGLAGRPLPGPVVAHSTRGVATSWARLRGVPLADLCTSATWASPSTFARFYQVNVVSPGVVEEAVLGTAAPPVEDDCRLPY